MKVLAIGAANYGEGGWERGLSSLALIRSPEKSSLHTGLDIGYVPAGPHAFFRSSGQFGPQQFILCWPAGPVSFRSVANACTSFFLLSIFIHRVILPVRTSIKTW